MRLHHLANAVAAPGLMSVTFTSNLSNGGLQMSQDVKSLTGGQAVRPTRVQPFRLHSLHCINIHKNAAEAPANNRQAFDQALDTHSQREHSDSLAGPVMRLVRLTELHHCRIRLLPAFLSIVLSRKRCNERLQILG